MTTVDDLTVAMKRLREGAQAVGAALSSVKVYTEPAIDVLLQPS